MNSQMAKSSTFVVTDFLNLMQPKTMRKEEVLAPVISKSAESLEATEEKDEEELSPKEVKEPEMGKVEQADDNAFEATSEEILAEERQAEAVPVPKSPEEEKLVQLAVAGEKSEESEKSEEKSPEMVPIAQAPVEEEEKQKSSDAHVAPFAPPAGRMKSESVASDTAVTEAPIAETSAPGPKESPEAVDQVAQAVSERASALDTESSGNVSEISSEQIDGSAAREKALDARSVLGHANLNEILQDIRQDGENRLKVSTSSAMSPNSVVDFFDVQTITVSDFHQSSHPRGPLPPESQASQGAPRTEVTLPPSNLELEALFAEMDEMEEVSKPVQRKPKAVRKLEKATTSALSKLKTKQERRRERVKENMSLEKKRYDRAEKKAKENILKYAKLREHNYKSILGDVQNALIEAEVAAYTLETGNQELHAFLNEVESEQYKNHQDYISKLQDHLSLVEAQIAGTGE